MMPKRLDSTIAKVAQRGKAVIRQKHSDDCLEPFSDLDVCHNMRRDGREPDLIGHE